MNPNHIKQRIRTARSTGADFADSTPPEVQSVLMDLASIAEHLLEQAAIVPQIEAIAARMSLVTRNAAMAYEIRGSWWTAATGWKWSQGIAAWWFARKVLRKYRRYSMSMIEFTKQNLTQSQTRR